MGPNTSFMLHRFFDFPELAPRDRYKLLSGSVLPRPIALITTCTAAGRSNAAPFSFFGLLSHDPAILAIGIENHSDGSPKDTARNIIETGQFTVHIPDRQLANEIEACAAPVGPEVNELELAKLDTVAGRHVICPRIVRAPVALECRLQTRLDLGTAREIILGEIVGLFVREDAVDDRLHVDPDLIDAIGRMGGRVYATTRDRFEV